MVLFHRCNENSLNNIFFISKIHTTFHVKITCTESAAAVTKYIATKEGPSLTTFLKFLGRSFFTATKTVQILNLLKLFVFCQKTSNYSLLWCQKVTCSTQVWKTERSTKGRFFSWIFSARTCFSWEQKINKAVKQTGELK